VGVPHGATRHRLVERRGPDSWGVPATFFDFDRDGLVDLFVGDYLHYSLKNDVPCFSDSGKPDYCRPHVYRPQPTCIRDLELPIFRQAASSSSRKHRRYYE